TSSPSSKPLDPNCKPSSNSPSEVERRVTMGSLRPKAENLRLLLERPQRRRGNHRRRCLRPVNGVASVQFFLSRSRLPNGPAFIRRVNSHLSNVRLTHLRLPLAFNVPVKEATQPACFDVSQL